MIEETLVSAYIVIASLLGIAYGLFNFYIVASIRVEDQPPAEWGLENPMDLIEDKVIIEKKKDAQGNEVEVQRKVKEHASWSAMIMHMKFIRKQIADGANGFLMEEYRILAIFCLCFSIVIAVLVEEQIGQLWTVTAFLLGCGTSILSGWIGMKVAVAANIKTGYSCIDRKDGLANGFVAAFRAGCVLGFTLVSLGLLNLYVLIELYNYLKNPNTTEDYRHLYECIAGYGLGGSTIAMFGRVGGGIYTKAADVGADLAGKVEADLDEDDPRNPATIADNVGDNVGDIAGMGSDLFGSFAEATCAALIIAATCVQLNPNWGALLFPLEITATGIFASFATSLFATNWMKVDQPEKIERTLKYQLIISTLILTPMIYILAVSALPNSFDFELSSGVSPLDCFWSVAIGLWAGLCIGIVTEYFTSSTYKPVRDVANACRVSTASNIIFGLALGYLSVIIPIFCLAITIFISFELAGMYGIALAALGMLSNLCIALAIDGYGPVSDNAGGIVEMTKLKKEVREKTDALDAAGNTTAAIGKGFAIGSAALVSLALFGAFITRSRMDHVNILSPLEFSGLLIGAMLPYVFSALTMKSVGEAANEMVEEVRRQFRLIRSGEMKEPDPQQCVAISTRSALKEMILPGLIVMLSPIVTGWLFGAKAVAGLLAGVLVSGVQMAISMANSGGAWDNAKKFIEKEGIVKKSDPAFKEIKNAAVNGDTVGDPFKDTSGPSLNILIKLSAITSLVFGGFFVGEFGGILSDFVE